MEYQFTVDWFTPHWPHWIEVTHGRNIRTALEVGSFEGLSTCRMIEHFGARNEFHIFCIDTWAGGREHGKELMTSVEERFDSNTTKAIADSKNLTKVTKLKGFSSDHLFALVSQGMRASFDLVFIDGSHQAADVLLDILLSYELARVGALLICDDYLWKMEQHGAEDLLNCPRLAIDAFKNIYARKVLQLSRPAYQCYLEKTA
jgi:predicted O-methyltransferase YrrM